MGQPLVPPADHEADLLRGAVGHVETLGARPGRSSADRATSAGGPPPAAPRQAGQVAVVDVADLGHALEHGGGRDESGDPVALDEVEGQVGPEALHQHDGVAVEDDPEGHEAVGVVERRRAEDPLDRVHGSEPGHHGRRGGRRRIVEGRVQLDDHLRGPGRPRAAHPPAPRGTPRRAAARRVRTPPPRTRRVTRRRPPVRGASRRGARSRSHGGRSQRMGTTTAPTFQPANPATRWSTEFLRPTASGSPDPEAAGGEGPGQPVRPLLQFPVGDGPLATVLADQGDRGVLATLQGQPGQACAVGDRGVGRGVVHRRLPRGPTVRWSPLAHGGGW